MVKSGGAMIHKPFSFLVDYIVKNEKMKDILLKSPLLCEILNIFPRYMWLPI